MAHMLQHTAYVTGGEETYCTRTTQSPSSQGWASKCLVLSAFVGMCLYVHVHGVMGFIFLLPLFSWCAIHIWFHVRTLWWLGQRMTSPQLY